MGEKSKASFPSVNKYFDQTVLLATIHSQYFFDSNKTIPKFSCKEVNKNKLQVEDITESVLFERNRMEVINSIQDAGYHELKWKTKDDIPSGIYMIRLSGTDFTSTKKAVLLK